MPLYPQVMGSVGSLYGAPDGGGSSLGMLMGGLGSMGGGRSAGGFGGGGGGVVPNRKQYQQDPYGNLYAPGESWTGSPGFGLEQQKQKFAQDRFNAVWNTLGPAFGRAQAGAFGQPGGDSGQGPEISVGGVYTPQQTNQEVNAARARTGQVAESQARDFAGSATGRGFGATSPLIQAMRTQLQGQAMATSADQERQIRAQHAEANAGQRLGSQKAREQQYAARQQEQIERQKPYFQNVNALIAALAGLA